MFLVTNKHKTKRGPGWLNELGRWIFKDKKKKVVGSNNSYKPITIYGVGSRPAL